MKPQYLLALLFISTLGWVGCNHPEPTTPTPEQTNMPRTVVYSVGNNERSKNLKTDAEWDALLDQLCDFASEGQSVAFYSLMPPASTLSTKADDKERITFSTTNRAEMKEWMKKMEKEGRTVNVNYDQGTGVWSGVAYTSLGGQPTSEGSAYTGTLVLLPSPTSTSSFPIDFAVALQINDDSILYLAIEGELLIAGNNDIFISGTIDDESGITLHGTIETLTTSDNQTYMILNIRLFDEASIAGEWRLASLTKMVVDADSPINNIMLYWWDDNGSPVQYQLADNGDATLTQEGNTQSGHWTLSAQGTLCCELFEGSTCWNINWLSQETLILSCEDYSSTEGVVFYQMELSAH